MGAALAASPQLTPSACCDARALQELIRVCLDVVAQLAEADPCCERGSGLPRSSPVPPPVFDVRLTRREMEIARLVSHGFTNRQIAARLCVSTRTVDSHVSHILRKLGLLARSQIAAWIVEHEHGTGLTLLG
jgi:DNA-binding NarL/FixJ family response regulator